MENPTKTIILTISITLFFTPLLHAKAPKNNNTLTAQKAVLACLGEAEGESQTGKIAMMEALRNRNNLDGVFGYKAVKLINGKYHKKVMKSGNYFKRTGKAYRPISNTTVIACQAAWVDSAYTNYVKGATHWEAVQTFGKPKWAKNMIQTAKIGNHTFFKNRD